MKFLDRKNPNFIRFVLQICLTFGGVVGFICLGLVLEYHRVQPEYFFGAAIAWSGASWCWCFAWGIDVLRLQREKFEELDKQKQDLLRVLPEEADAHFLWRQSLTRVERPEGDDA